MKRLLLFSAAGLLAIWIAGIILVNFFNIDLDSYFNSKPVPSQVMQIHTAPYVVTPVITSGLVYAQSRPTPQPKAPRPTPVPKKDPLKKYKNKKVDPNKEGFSNQ